MSLIYYEDSSPDLGISWKNIQSIDSIITQRNTHVEMVEHPQWGLTCYMDNTIQSSEVDEAVYHETLVHPAMACAFYRKRIMIVGGGEGATAREVLKWPDVEQVDMYDWDKDIVSLFKEKYPQWAKGAWEDSRLNLHYDDIFEMIKTHPAKRYDVIIIDLFDYSEKDKDKWATLLYHLPYWANGSVVIYAGMRCISQKEQSYHVLSQMLRQHASPISILTRLQSPQNASVHDHFIADYEIVPYRIFIPSFMGEATFLLIKSRATVCMFEKVKQFSHLTRDIWKSYKTFNW